VDALTAVALVAALFLVPPWVPAMPAAGLDPSWHAVLSHAVDKGWQFGKDIVFTYGPYGFLRNNLYHPDRYALTLAFWSLVALMLVAGVASLTAPQPRLIRGTVLAVLVLALHVHLDVMFLFIPFLLLVSYAASARLLVPPLVALSAFIGLVKFNFALLGFAIVVLIDAHRFLNSRRLPSYLLLYLTVAFVFFSLAGQSPENFTRYISTSVWIARGYSEAMQLGGPFVEVLSFAVVAACFLASALRLEWTQSATLSARAEGLLLVLGIAVFVYMVFKAGFIRHSANHPLLAWAVLSAALGSYAALTHTATSRVRAAVLTLCLASAMATLVRFQQVLEPASLGQHFAATILERGRAISGILRGDYASSQRSAYAAAWEAIRRDNPLPALQGTVDIYPWNQSAVLAHGLEYRPRPVFQSYAVYSGQLIELNRAHVRSDRAAAHLLFDVKTIDDRISSLDDGQLWPEIIARYQPEGVADGYLVLTKRTERRNVELVPRSNEITTWLTPVEMPNDLALVWIGITVRKNFLGVLANLLFKVPAVMLIVTFEDATKRQVRIVPAMAKEGFLLAPRVDTPSDFLQLMEDAAALNTRARRVASIQLFGEPGVRWFYSGSIELSFAELCIERCKAKHDSYRAQRKPML
jgi:hypothetical protein